MGAASKSRKEISQLPIDDQFCGQASGYSLAIHHSATMACRVAIDWL
jgi:hypothetical protein